MCIVINKGIVKGKSKFYGVEVNHNHVKIYGENGSYERLFLSNLRSYVIEDLHNIIREEIAKVLINKTQSTFNYNKLMDAYSFDKKQIVEGELYSNRNISSKGDGKGTVYIGIKGKNKNENNLFIMALKDIKREGNKIQLVGKSTGLEITVDIENENDFLFFEKRLKNRLAVDDTRYIKYIDISKLLEGIDNSIKINH